MRIHGPVAGRLTEANVLPFRLSVLKPPTDVLRRPQKRLAPVPREPALLLPRFGWFADPVDEEAIDAPLVEVAGAFDVPRHLLVEVVLLEESSGPFARTL